MKRMITALLLLSFTAPLLSEGLESYQENTEEIYRTGAGSEDGAFTAISTSMLGWGVGLAVGIAILASVLHQSNSSHSHTTSN